MNYQNKKIFIFNKRNISFLPLISLFIVSLSSAAPNEARKLSKLKWDVKEAISKAEKAGATELAPYALALAKEYERSSDIERTDKKVHVTFLQTAEQLAGEALKKAGLPDYFVIHQKKYLLKPDTPEGFYDLRKKLETLEKRFYQFNPQLAKYQYPKLAAHIRVLFERVNETISEGSSKDEASKLLKLAEASLVKLEIAEAKDINFQKGTAKIDDLKQPYLRHVWMALKENPAVKLVIKGYADIIEKPMKLEPAKAKPAGKKDERKIGTESEQLKLSVERAQSVKNWLVARGINPKRIKAEGYGSNMPVATNKTGEGQRRNRRIEFSDASF